MGVVLSCCIDRGQTGRIRYITFDQFQNDGVGYMALKAEEKDERRIHKAILNRFEKMINKDVDPKNEKQEITLSEIDYMTTHLKDLGIDKETPVMCYDSSDGKRAARLACLVSSIGLKYVTILDRKIEEDPKSEINVTNARQGCGKIFDFASKLDYFAKLQDLSIIINDEKSETSIVDVRSTDMRTKGQIPKSKHIQLTDLYHEGNLSDQDKIHSVFKWAGVSKDKPVIFYGGDDAYVLKAIADHAGFTAKTQVLQQSYEEWVAWNKVQENIQLEKAKHQQVEDSTVEVKIKDAPSGESKK